MIGGPDLPVLPPVLGSHPCACPSLVMKEKINLEESLMFGMFVFSVDRKEEKRCICLSMVRFEMERGRRRITDRLKGLRGGWLTQKFNIILLLRGCVRRDL